MAIESKSGVYRIYLVAVIILLMAAAIGIKLFNIQWVEGDYYREKASQNTIKSFVIPANKGNIYSSDGSLLATSIPKYTIRFDAVSPTREHFKSNIEDLADSLSSMFGKSSGYYKTQLRRARRDKNRYYLVAKDLTYTEFLRIKSFPLFKLGAYKGGFINEQKTVREHPVGEIALRTIGYSRVDEHGVRKEAGIEGAFKQYLNGKDGRLLKQKIAKGQWKPLRDDNEVEPHDGYDVISTIDVYIQDIAHHALLKQLQYYQADHGCVVVMESKTGEVKAISNLGRASNGNYYEKLNYAVGESHEPGSTFKLLDLIALLDDELVDTSAVFDSFNGKITYKGKNVIDSHEGGYGKISLARGFEVSSNTVMVQAVYNNYRRNPQKFVDRINSYGLNKPLGLPFVGEGKPLIPQRSDKNWSSISLPWMAFGYGVSVTPLQTLSLYNAIANDGEMIKPIFVKEIREFNKTIKKFDKIVINPKICSDETISKVRAVLENVVKKGTGQGLYSKNFSMAGKTGTAQVDYAKDGGAGKYYASSFVGYFPADEPKYSCIVVVHKPSTINNNYYGADVAGPVFKRIAQKIFTDTPSTNEVKYLQKKYLAQEGSYEKYYELVEMRNGLVPRVIGLPGMDAVAVLENLGLKVKVRGVGKVRTQSLLEGEKISKGKTIILELS